MTTKHANISIIALLALLFAGPFIASAQVSYPAGIENCGQGVGGGLSQNVGSYQPIGGPYVPVVDSAVELNTATLVYKQCVLDEIVSKQKEAAMAAIVKDMVTKFASGRNGGPLFPVYYQGDMLSRGDFSITRTLQGSTLNALNPAYRNLIKGAIALNYSVDTRAYDNTVACPYQGDINQMLHGQAFSFSGFLAESDPRCDPLFAYYLSQDIVRRNIALDREEMLYRLSTGNGIYGVEGFDANGNRITLLPGTLVHGNTQFALTSGMRQLESAKSVGEITNAGFASMADMSITPGNQNPSNNLSGGLFNLTNAGSGAQNALYDILNSALNRLLGSSASSTEQKFHQTAVDIRDKLLQPTADGIHTAETKCWSDTTHSDDFINQHGLAELNGQTFGALVNSVQLAVASSSDAISKNQQVHSTSDLSTIRSLQSALAEVMPAKIIQDAVDLWKGMSGSASTCGT